MTNPCDYKPFICPYSNDPTSRTCDWYCGYDEPNSYPEEE